MLYQRSKEKETVFTFKKQESQNESFIIHVGTFHNSVDFTDKTVNQRK